MRPTARLLIAIAIMAGSIVVSATLPSSAQVTNSPYAETFCLGVGSEALSVLMARRTRKDFSSIERDLRNRIPDSHDLAEELRVARSVWDDHRTPELDVASKVEAACRAANGLPPKSPPPPPHTYLPCTFYATAASRYAHERNIGFSMESRLNELSTDSHFDQVVLNSARRMIQDLWELPLITPQEAYAMALRSCGWPRLP